MYNSLSSLFECINVLFIVIFVSLLFEVSESNNIFDPFITFILSDPLFLIPKKTKYLLFSLISFKIHSSICKTFLSSLLLTLK